MIAPPFDLQGFAEWATGRGWEFHVVGRCNRVQWHANQGFLGVVGATFRQMRDLVVAHELARANGKRLVPAEQAAEVSHG